MKRTAGIVAAAVYIASVVVANWLTTHYGFVPVGFGLMTTAGTYAAGVALAARDAIQDALGKRIMLGALAIAVALSFIVADPHIALASAIAFAIGELIDFGVYTPLRNRSRLGDRRWVGAVVASNIVGAIIDTVVFIGIAFGLAALAPHVILGQLVGKAYATVAYLIVGKGASLAVLRKPDREPGCA